MNYKKLTKITDAYSGVEIGRLADHLQWLTPFRDEFKELIPEINKVLRPYRDVIDKVYYEDWFNGLPYLIISIKGEDKEALDNFGTFCYVLFEENITLDSQVSHYDEPEGSKGTLSRLLKLEEDLNNKVTPILKKLNGRWDDYRQD